MHYCAYGKHVCQTFAQGSLAKQMLGILAHACMHANRPHDTEILPTQAGMLFIRQSYCKTTLPLEIFLMGLLYVFPYQVPGILPRPLGSTYLEAIHLAKGRHRMFNSNLYTGSSADICVREPWHLQHSCRTLHLHYVDYLQIAQWHHVSVEGGSSLQHEKLTSTNCCTSQTGRQRFDQEGMIGGQLVNSGVFNKENQQSFIPAHQLEHGRSSDTGPDRGLG